MSETLAPPRRPVPMPARPAPTAGAAMAAGDALRVRVRAADPERRRALAGLVEAAGHRPVMGAAEILLADLPDGAGLPEEDLPVLALGERSGLARDGALAGLLPRDPAPAQVDAALRAVAAGLLVRAPGTPLPVDGFHPAPDEPRPAVLTPREVEILALIGQGMSNKEVARRLGISAHTVKFHLEAIFAKLDAGSRAEAVAKGLRGGVIEL